MRRESHVQFGRRAGETDQRKRWNRAPARPSTLVTAAHLFITTLRLDPRAAAPA
jgi:hypothetical protein